MKDLKFKCFKCKKYSPFEISVGNRDEIRRILPEKNQKLDVNFICLNCGTANLIPITMKMAVELVKDIDINDPNVNRAINKALGGDVTDILSEARKRFKF